MPGYGSAQQQGYNELFLGSNSRIEMPKPDLHLMSEIYQDESLRDGYIVDYDNYSVILNGEEDKRSAACVALMIDQKRFKKTRRKDNWRTDPRIPDSYQLDNAYYRSNPWDRGHLARRTTAAWGDSVAIAQARSNGTFVYTNAALQHSNLNQDEWLSLEDMVKDYGQTQGRIISFNGCIYGKYDRSIKPNRRKVARIPCGFYKVIAYLDKATGTLCCRAFVFYQDSESLRDKRGSRRSTYDNMTYQVSLMEVTELTGLQFDAQLYDANPLYYNGENRSDDENVLDKELPERIEQFSGDSVISPLMPRETVLDDEVDAFISAALIKDDLLTVSIFNGGSDDIIMDDWKIVDVFGNLYVLDQTLLKFGESLVSQFDHFCKDTPYLILYNDRDERIDWVRIAGHSDKAQMFLSPTSLTDL